MLKPHDTTAIGSIWQGDQQETYSSVFFTYFRITGGMGDGQEPIIAECCPAP